MSTGSTNSFNASLSANFNRWLKHQIKDRKHHQKKEKQFYLKHIQENVYEMLQKQRFLNQEHPDYQLVQRL